MDSSSSDSPSSASTDESAIFGDGPYFNIRKGIELRQISDDFSGLFATQDFPAGTILWKNRGDGPAERNYRKIYGEDIQHLTEAELKYFIRYSYQNGDEFFISPLNEEEVNMDYSNFWNHSCQPSTLPLDEDHWIAIRDIKTGEQLTIDYSTFDSNPFICIDRCLCGTPSCREFVRGDDYRIRELQHRYAGHFLPYIAKRIEEEAELIARGCTIGGAGGERNEFTADSVRAYHRRTNIDIEAHNKAGIKALVERFSSQSTATPSTSTSSHLHLDTPSSSNSPAMSPSPESLSRANSAELQTTIQTIEVTG